jgi:SAM-dependent methyltransferase
MIQFPAATGWHEDETFWDFVSPFIFQPGTFAEQEQTVAQLLALAGVERGEVLDLCCGPGRHAIPLARRGFAVTGVDRSPVLLRQTQETAEEKGVRVELVRSDMRRFVRPAAFDLALNLSVSFGYFEDPAENLAVLANVRESLRPGGTFILEVSGKEVEARRFRDIGSWDAPGHGIVVQRRRIVDDWDRMEMEWIFLADGATRFLKTCHWLYSGHELKALLAGAGFRQATLHGNFAGDPYGPDADSLIAVAVK